VIRYLVKHVSQFPSDSELTRYINTLSDPDHAKKCEKCVEAVITAKEEQANKAIKNADKLLEEIDAEKVRKLRVGLGMVWTRSGYWWLLHQPSRLLLSAVSGINSNEHAL